MRKLYVILILAVASFAAAHAQGTPQSHAGNKAILFSINGFGDFGVSGTVVGSTPISASDTLTRLLSQLVGTEFIRPVYGVAMKFYLADNVALRAGVGFNSTSNTTPVPGSTTGQETKDSRSAFGIAPGVELNLTEVGPVSFYTGAEVTFATASTSSGEDSTKTTDTQTGFGGGVLLGVEFYPWNNVSLGAEYALGVEVSSTSRSVGSKSTDGPSSTSFGINGPVRVTLAVHI